MHLLFSETSLILHDLTHSLGHWQSVSKPRETSCIHVIITVILELVTAIIAIIAIIVIASVIDHGIIIGNK